MALYQHANSLSAFIVLNTADMVIDLSEVAGNRALPFGLHVFGDSTLAMLGKLPASVRLHRSSHRLIGLANSGILFNTLRIVAPVLHTGQCLANPNLRPPGLVTSDSESFFAPSSSPIDPPAKAPFSELKPSVSNQSAQSLVKAHTAADGYLAPMLPAHFAPGRRSHASVNLSDAMAALKLPVPHKRGSRAQSPDRSASRYSFPRVHAKASAHRSAPTPPKPPSQPSRPRTNGDASRHKPPPLEVPLRSPVILPTVTIASPRASDSGERSPQVRVVHSDVEHRVITSPPHSAAILSVSRPASFVDETVPAQSDHVRGVPVQPSPARSTFSTRSAPSTLPSRSAMNSMQPLLGVPGARARAPNDVRGSVASSVHAPSIASSMTSYRGLPPNPKALRAAWDEAAVKKSSPLSSSFSAADLRPPTAMSGRLSAGKAAMPFSSAGVPSQSSASLATMASAPPHLGATPGKPSPGRPIPRARSNNDIRAARTSGARPMLPRAASASASTIATRSTFKAPSAMSIVDINAGAASPRPSAELLSTRTPSVAGLRSPSAVSLVGDGAVPLLVGRRRTVRSSKSVVVSPGGYI